MIYHANSLNHVRDEASVFKISKIDSPKRMYITDLQPDLEYQVTNLKVILSVNHCVCLFCRPYITTVAGFSYFINNNYFKVSLPKHETFSVRGLWNILIFFCLDLA